MPVIGDEDVEPSKGGNGRGHQRPAVGWRTQILLDGNAVRRPSAFSSQRFSLLARLAVVERHPRSSLHKQPHRGRANSPRAAGDERNLVFEHQRNTGHRGHAIAAGQAGANILKTA